jgi:serine protease Do
MSGRFLLALVSGVALSACSPKASTAVPPVESAAPEAAVMLPVAAQAIATPPASAAPVQPLVTGLPDFTALVERYGPAVVNVRVDERPQAREAQQRRQQPPDSAEEFFRRFGIPDFPGFEIDPREQTPRRGEGSGFIVSPDGYIMTNAHVVMGASEVVVTLSDRRELDARVVGFDETTDVAVIKVEGSDLPAVKLGDSSKLKPGQWVVAIGSPFGMQNSVTAGIVSATSRDLQQDTYVPFIQTDAAVNPGNSGGPLFNLQGEVVGINSQIYSQNGGYMGLSFAIPIDIADNVRNQLVKTGKFTRSRIGVEIQTLNAASAEAWGLDRPRGALVNSVVSGDPADKAGIRPGDIILSVNGKPVEGNNSLASMISVLSPGSAVEMEIWREKKLRTLTANVAAWQDEEASVRPVRRETPNAPPAASGPTVLGMSLRPLTAAERRDASARGVLVVEQVDGAAATAGIEPGDIVVDVAGTPVRSVAELEAAIKASTGRHVPLGIQRGEATRYVTVRKE